MDIRDLTEATFDCLGLAQSYAEAAGHDHVCSGHLFTAVLADRGVLEALARSGASDGYLSALRAVAASAASGRTSRPAPEVAALIERARELAHADEHCDVAPGHLLLAFTEDPGGIARLELMAEGIDVATLHEALAEDLAATATRADEAAAADDGRFAPLTAPEVARLAQQMLVNRDAAARLRERSDLMDEEEIDELTAQRRFTRSAWFALLEHHRYLAIAAARTHAAHGHRFAYAYMLALHALQESADRYTPTDGDFSRFAQRLISERLADALADIEH